MKKEYWKMLSEALHEMREPLHAIGGFAYLLKEDELRPSLADDERYDVLCRLDQSYSKLLRQMNVLTDLAYYQQAGEVERRDKVAVNQLCRELAEEQDVKVLYKSDIPDYYVITTNQEALVKVISVLLDRAASRVLKSGGGEREPLVFLCVTERGEKGRLTFAVTDTAPPDSEEENIRVFDLPTTSGGRSIVTLVEIHTCWLMVRLLGGFIYIDPSYGDGRRVIFDIAL